MRAGVLGAVLGLAICFTTLSRMSDHESKRYCTYEHCERPGKGNRFHRIEEGKTTGGQDWSSLVGSVLCSSCYSTFRRKGTLERAQPQTVAPQHAGPCTYEHCERPGESSHFYQIEEGGTAGGQDWSSLVGSVLCSSCYSRFRTKGTLERSQPQTVAPQPAGPCTYEHCERPGKGNRFHRIEEGKTTGGQDWSSLVGSVLCSSCYSRFRTRGTLERAQPQTVAPQPAGPCTYEHCERPGESSHFYQIEEGGTAGGQDWSSLVGSVLCSSCYSRFRTKGTLEKTNREDRGLAESEKVCAYEHCVKNPVEGNRFTQIEEGKTTGGQDWSSLVGKVLCHGCYNRFRTRGTLEKTLGRPLAKSEKRCAYEHCEWPSDGSSYYLIGESKKAGGQDWSSLVGSVLCKACYMRFKERGTLEKSSREGKSDRRCSYEHCNNLGEISKFIKVEEGKTTGGQDWSSLVGSLLCQSCYSRFRTKGTLERAQPRTVAPQSAWSREALPEDAGKRQKKSDETIGKARTSTSSRSREVHNGLDVGECMLCMEGPRTVCVVPCGHSALCGSCGDLSLFKEGSNGSSNKGASKKRPLTECPVCSEDLCPPWVMPRGEWESLGGAARLLQGMCRVPS